MIDNYILASILVNLLILLFLKKVNSIFFIYPTFYTLFNIFTITLRELLGPINHKENGEYRLYIRNSVRWFIYAFINVFIVILCYSILFLKFGNQFTPNINKPLTAFYHSIMTFTTLGYGDIKPTCDLSKTIVISELIYFIMVVLGKIPIAASVIKVRINK